MKRIFLLAAFFLSINCLNAQQFSLTELIGFANYTQASDYDSLMVKHHYTNGLKAPLAPMNIGDSVDYSVIYNIVGNRSIPVHLIFYNLGNELKVVYSTSSFVASASYDKSLAMEALDEGFNIIGSTPPISNGIKYLRMEKSRPAYKLFFETVQKTEFTGGKKRIYNNFTVTIVKLKEEKK